MIQPPVAAIVKPLSTKPSPLNAEQLLTFPGCENYSTEQAEAIVLSIQKLAGVLLEFTRQENINTIDNQHIVYLNPENKSPLLKNIAA